MRKLILLAIMGYFLVGCDILQKTKEDPIRGAGAITIKFVQINDVYEIAPLGGGEFGGLARVGHIRDSIKKLYPNTYLFLAGDFLNPSLLGTLKVDGERLNGKQMIEVLNALEVDLVTFGNHEFDLSEKDLQKRMDESRFAWTSANVRHVTENGIVPFATKWEYTTVPASDYSIFALEDPDGNDVKFGVFGVTLPSNPKEYVSYGNIYDNAVRAYELAIQKADFVVGLTHVAIEEDIEIAKRLRSLPLIMGGHEHFNMLEREGKTIIAKADANAKSVYIHTLIYDLRTKHLHVSSVLKMVTDEIASSPKIERIVNKWTQLLNENLKETVKDPDKVIFHASQPLDGTDDANRSKQTNLGKIIAQSMAYVYDGEVEGALVNGGSVRIDDKLVGDISSKDIFRILPFGGSVLKVDLTGELLIEVLNYGNRQSGNGAYLQRYNFTQNPVGEWLIGENLILAKNIYTIAFSDFLLKGLDIPFLNPSNKNIVKIYTPLETEVAGDIRKTIISYLKSQDK